MQRKQTDTSGKRVRLKAYGRVAIVIRGLSRESDYGILKLSISVAF